MRIVVSGTHASGKSTLITDFTARHPGYTVLPDPFDLLDETWDAAGAASFAAQLRIAASRLLDDDLGGDIIAERGPLDFLAYLLALDELTGDAVPRELLVRSSALTAEALRHADLLVILPLDEGNPLVHDFDEHPELRDAMNDALLDLLEDSDVIGDLTVIELAGDRDERLAALESAVDAAT
ncbi:AAA family ATPase [Microbacterium sp. NPDC058389]|uniref:AAA family ATPase n=1 Tax=Microbacterium sp. NPDC058389 TaxID=3346475 RepID=UPI00366773D9